MFNLMPLADSLHAQWWQTATDHNFLYIVCILRRLQPGNDTKKSRLDCTEKETLVNDTEKWKHKDVYAKSHQFNAKSDQTSMLSTKQNSRF